MLLINAYFNLFCIALVSFQLSSDNPSTPLNNLDPKFYDTPRSHNNIGLNLTNDQSYSPKITNFGTVSKTLNKSVFFFIYLEEY